MIKHLNPQAFSSRLIHCIASAALLEDSLNNAPLCGPLLSSLRVVEQIEKI